MKKVVVVGCLFFSSIYTLDVTVETPSGNYFIMEVEDFETLANLQQNIESDLNLPIDRQELIVKSCDYETLLAAQQENMVRKPAHYVRNYDAPVTNAEKKDIRYIVQSLADKSLFSLLRHKGSLEAAGDRINQVHPLRFLMCIFTDPELKRGVKDIYKRGGWVWSDFIGGLNSSLEEESYRNNLRDDQVNDFAKVVGVNPNLIFPAIRKRHWTEFVVILIKKT